jgi:hypothetical protein
MGGFETQFSLNRRDKDLKAVQIERLCLLYDRGYLLVD